MKKVFIRVDGGKGIGLGHIMRMLVLGKELAKKCHVLFLCINDKSEKYLPGIIKIKESQFSVIELSNECINEISEVQKELQADLLITDSYNVDSNYFNEMRKHFPKTAYMYDIDVCDINVDLIINQNINAEEIKYDRVINKDAKFLLGTNYLLLREEFRIKPSIFDKDVVRDIMITLGGTDESYLTLKIIELLKGLDCTLHVILGSAFEKTLIDEINAVKTEKLRIITYKNAIMSEVMDKSNMAISACGSTLYELGAMNVPTIGIVIADNQKEIAKVMDKCGLIINTGNMINEDREKFKNKIYEVIVDKKLRSSLVNKTKEYINKHGVEKIANEIYNIIK